jgi:uncharacterized protein (DUF427 family)
MTNPVPDPKRAGQQSVWDFPRPAVAELTRAHLKIIHSGVTIAETTLGVRSLEKSHPPGSYVPHEDVVMALFAASANRSFCEWESNVTKFDVSVKGEIFADVAWSYPRPTAIFLALRDHVAFFAAPFESCFVDGEKVVPQPGGFYGGWIIPKLAGPLKGALGSQFL